MSSNTIIGMSREIDVRLIINRLKIGSNYFEMSRTKKKSFKSRLFKISRLLVYTDNSIYSQIQNIFRNSTDCDLRHPDYLQIEIVHKPRLLNIPGSFLYVVRFSTYITLGVLLPFDLLLTWLVHLSNRLSVSCCLWRHLQASAISTYYHTES